MSTPPANDPRPLLAIATGHLTPYREHFHRRIVAEIPELQLVTLLTKRRTNQWLNRDIPEINTVMLDPGPDVDRSGLTKLRHELGTAGVLTQWLASHSPACVIVSGYDELPSIRTLRWAKRSRTPAMLWADSNVHGDLASGLKRAIKNIYVPWITSSPKALLVCGTVGKQFFRRYGVGDDRLFVVPYEPDYAMIEDFPVEETHRLCASMGLAPGRKRMLCCCRLIDVKRVDLVIDAFHEVARELPEWDLVICGDGPLRGQLQAQVQSHAQLAGRVRFVGFQDQRGVTALYRQSHVLALASDYEPWALVVNEAACAGLAIIATDRVGAAEELVRDGVNGRIVPSGNLKSLADAMRSVLAAGRASEMGQESIAVLKHWRSVGDPIRGLRAALSRAGVLPST